MDKKFELFQWSWSAFGCDTAFFYFKEPDSYDLLMVEFWADEDRVADYGQYYTIDGELIEDESRELTDEEKKYLNNFCQRTIAGKSVAVK